MTYRWELLIWLWLAFFLNQADRQVFNVLLPVLRRDLGLSDIQLGLLTSVFVAVNGVLVPVAGFLGDRIARRRLVLLSLFAWSFSTLCTGFGSGLAYFLLVRSIATAAGEAFYFPAAVAMLASEHVESRGRALSLFQTSVYAGLIASGWLGGALAQRLGWRAVFWIFGGAGMLLAVALRFRIRNSAVVAAAERPSIRSSLAAILTKPAARWIALASGATIFVNIGYLTWMPVYLFDRFGMPLSKAGFSSMFFHHVLAFAGAITGGFISDHLAPGRPRIRMELQAFALLAGAPFIFALGRAATEGAVYLALAGFGFFRGLFESNLYPAFYSVIAPRYHSTASGLLIAFSFLLASGAPVLLGAIKQMASLAEGLSMLAALYIVGALAALWGSRKVVQTI
ncbi:MAG TPA: MFS transporter [Bryobacteraceae bacterium]|jgi:MFS family permease|nr:MFS transporter [Bryobacteraceae bacterium]